MPCSFKYCSNSLEINCCPLSVRSVSGNPKRENIGINPFRSYVASEATLVFSPIGPMSPLRRQDLF